MSVKAEDLLGSQDLVRLAMDRLCESTRSTLSSTRRQSIRESIVLLRAADDRVEDEERGQRMAIALAAASKPLEAYARGPRSKPHGHPPGEDPPLSASTL